MPTDTVDLLLFAASSLAVVAASRLFKADPPSLLNDL
jgi:hypothetical protein